MIYFCFYKAIYKANCADYTKYECSRSHDKVIKKLGNDSRILMDWDGMNYLKS